MANPDKDVVDFLLAQHAEIRNLFDEVEKAPEGERKEPFRRLVTLLAVHETAEEELVHPFARRVVEGGDAIVDERLAEEREAKELLSRLEEMDPDSPEVLKKLDALRVAGFAHPRSEERYEFVKLRAESSEAQLRAMAA